MASTFEESNRLKRADSKKSHAWWWDSHTSPKNSKWLQDNLEEMDQHVKRMLKLLEEDANSFAQKAELYFKKRPELVCLVEEFYRMYCSLAARYDHVTGDLRRNMPSSLRSQSSRVSDTGSESPSVTSSHDRRLGHKAGPRAAGFDFFLGTGSNSNNKDWDESSTLGSESESDDSSVDNYSGMNNNCEENGLQKKIIELEAELREVKDKYESSKKPNHDESELGFKITAYEEELRVAREKIRQSEEEIIRLMIELQKHESLGDSNDLVSEGVVKRNDHEVLSSSTTEEQNQVRQPQESLSGLDAEVFDSSHRNRALEEELKVTQEKLHESLEEVARLKHEHMSKGGSYAWDIQHRPEKEASVYAMVKREVSKLLRKRALKNETDDSNRDGDIRGLKEILLL